MLPRLFDRLRLGANGTDTTARSIGTVTAIVGYVGDPSASGSRPRSKLRAIR
jgi:hypothetical protein